MSFKLKSTLLFLLLPVLFWGQNTLVNYNYDNADFPNPERGFYRYSDTYASAYTLLDSATLVGYRTLHQPFSANYQVYSTLVFRYFILDVFKNVPLSPSFLDNIQTDFNIARKAGVKLIVRFTYTVDVNSGPCGSWICPPYGDASKAIVLQHISQLKSVLHNHRDVIASVQMGFIGVWGEQYYTDYFGDASMPPYTLNNTNWNDRKEVLDSLLSAVPVPINVQVRYPQMKQKEVYGNSAPTSSPPLSAAEAFNNSNKSRIGFHNDCFLANYDDYGTYADYSSGASDTLHLKPYKAEDSKYVLVGGETCDSTGLWGLCDQFGGNVIEDMTRMHYTYLNADYNNTKVNNYWTNNCMDEVKLKLGYRLHLASGTYSTSAEQGSNFNYTIQLSNAGFASPINKRTVKLVFIHNVTGERFEASLDHDPRFWGPGNHMISGSLCIPSCMPAGNYAIHMQLSDTSKRLEYRPEYSIRLANPGLWNGTNGLNNLNHIVSITASSNSCLFDNSIKSINRWIGPNNANWNASNNYWSQGRIPTSCDEVIISEGKKVNIPIGFTAFAKKVTTIENAMLEVQTGALLKVED